MAEEVQQQTNQLTQWSFTIKGLIPEEVRLRRKVWLKKGELLLDKTGNDLCAYFLVGDAGNSFNLEERITPYLRFSSLISSNSVDVEGGSGIGISSKEKLGENPSIVGTVSFRKAFPEEAIEEIGNYAHKFIGFIGRLHDKYIDIVSENKFMGIALDYHYEAQKKFIYSDEGFISAVISMEAMFNEASSDITYKLSHRAAFLLGLCDIDPIEAFEKLKGFYNKRSKLIHGGGTLSHDPDRHLVSKYTRRSIIIFLILLKNNKRRNIGMNKRKGEILKEIDYAMFNEDMRKSLKKEITKGLKDFELTVPRTFEGNGKNGHYRVTVW